MLQFFQAIIDFINTSVNLIFTTLFDLNYVVTLMATVSAKLPMMIQFLPGPVSAIVSVSCAFAIIAKFLGRDG